MNRFILLSILAITAVGCGPSAEEKKALSELGMARAAEERDDIDAAMKHLDASLGTKATFDAYVFRSKLFWDEGQHGKSADDLQRIVKGWRGDERTKQLLDEHQQRAEEEAATVARMWVGRTGALREQTEKFLRDRLSSTRYWSQKTPAEREKYIESVLSRGFFRMHVESTIRIAD